MVNVYRGFQTLSLSREKKKFTAYISDLYTFITDKYFVFYITKLNCTIMN
jgi:hypothetical protein